MRIRLPFIWVLKALILAILLGLSVAGTAEARPFRNDPAQMFYADLAPYGDWVDHPVYGRVWFPRDIPPSWRPYQDGYWAYTSIYGWLWVSDWTWGWATDHYGRWVWDDWYGWIWIPGSIWAPAWVVWRYGDGYVSWAPMPIQYIWNPYVSNPTYYFDFDRYISSDCWVITHERDFPRWRYQRKFIPRQMSREILSRTRYADPLIVVNNHVVNQGVPLHRIERDTGISIKPVAPTVMLEPGHPNRGGDWQKNREEVVIYRPFHAQPTPETINEEAESGKVLAEKVNLNNQLSPDRDGQFREGHEPRHPGRFIGNTKPRDDQEADNAPAIQADTQRAAPSFLTLPDMQEKLQAGPAQNEPVNQPQQKHEGVGRLRRQGEEPLFQQGNQAQEPASQLYLQQRELERQQQAEQQRMQQDAIRQQEEASRQQQLEAARHQQAEQQRMQQETIRQQEEAARQQQLEAERQQQAEQQRMQQEAIRQQEEAARQQQLEAERQQQAEQQRMQQEAIRQQEEAARQQQLEAERQQQAEQQRMQQEAIRQQEEAARQQQLEAERQQQAEQQRMQQELIRQQQAVQQQQMEMHSPESTQQTPQTGGGRGRGQRGAARGRE